MLQAFEYIRHNSPRKRLQSEAIVLCATCAASNHSGPMIIFLPRSQTPGSPPATHPDILLFYGPNFSTHRTECQIHHRGTASAPIARNDAQRYNIFSPPSAKNLNQRSNRNRRWMTNQHFTPGCHVPKQQLSTGRKGEVVRRRGPGSSHENGPPCGGGGGGGSGEVVVEAQFWWWWRWWWWQGCGVYDVRFVHLLSSISHSLFVSACESDSCLWRCC